MAAAGAVVSRVRRVGAAAIALVGAVVDVVALLYGALAVVPLHTGRRGLRVVLDLVVKQLYFTGVQGLPLVSLAALALGTLIIVEANAYLPVEYAAPTAAHIITKDVIPLTVAIIVIGRSGTAICVELAGMKLSGQLDALVSLGLPLEHVIVLPRVAGGVLSMLALGVYAMAVSTAAGYALAKAIEPLPFTLQAIVDAVEPADLLLGGVKGLLFGTGFALVAIREGYSVEASAREIPQATTRAVVRGMGLCLVLNSVLTVLA